MALKNACGFVFSITYYSLFYKKVPLERVYFVAKAKKMRYNKHMRAVFFVADTRKARFDQCTKLCA